MKCTKNENKNIPFPFQCFVTTARENWKASCFFLSFFPPPPDKTLKHLHNMSFWALFSIFTPEIETVALPPDWIHTFMHSSSNLHTALRTSIFATKAGIFVSQPGQPSSDGLQQANRETWVRISLHAAHLRVDFWNPNGLKLAQKGARTRVNRSSRMQHEHISLPEHMSLYCLLSCQLPSCASAPRGESMCQHLHTFTQQVSEAASYVVFFLLLLVNICECVPKGADGQTVGCPTALQVAGASQNAEQTQQVLIPPPKHLSGPLTSSLIHSLGRSWASLQARRSNS